MHTSSKQPAIVITAKSISNRLPGKNMLTLGSMPLSEYALISAKQILNATVIVSTDIPELKNLTALYGYICVLQKPNLSHKQVIEEALKECNLTDSPCILLQPTSPFRTNNIVYNCWQKYLKYSNSTILTTSIHHNAQIINNKLENSHNSLVLWDGCVAIYPPYKVCDYSNINYIRNYHINTIQIDTKEDYEQACLMYNNIRSFK